ncbi:hypothetical protein KDL30_16430, partial [bacterium]|nr:hypothetical protein [bacterium]
RQAGPCKPTSYDPQPRGQALTWGNFTINETTQAGIGTAVTCDSGEIGAAGVTVALDPGEDVTSTFVNTLGGTIGFTTLLPIIIRGDTRYEI